MWICGNAPIGYQVENKQLLINKDEEPLARHIFDRYLALGSVQKLKNELNQNKKRSPNRTSKRGHEHGDSEFSRGALYSILKNPIYIGKIRHKDKIYDGQHEALISEDIWQRAQEILDKPVGARIGHEKARHKNLLQGLLFNNDGTPYSPAHTKKPNGKSYRYYVSQNLIQYRDHPKDIVARLPAHEIEQAVITIIGRHITDHPRLAEMLCLDEVEEHDVLRHITKSALNLENLIRDCVSRVLVGQDEFTIQGNLPKLRQHLENTLHLAVPVRSEIVPFILSTSFATQRAHRGTIMLRPALPEKSLHELPPFELRNLVRGVIWRDRHFAGEPIREIARKENLSEAGIRKIIMGSFDTLMAL